MKLFRPKVCEYRNDSLLQSGLAFWTVVHLADVSHFGETEYTTRKAKTLKFKPGHEHVTTVVLESLNDWQRKLVTTMFKRPGNGQWLIASKPLYLGCDNRRKWSVFVNFIATFISKIYSTMQDCTASRSRKILLQIHSYQIDSFLIRGCMVCQKIWIHKPRFYKRNRCPQEPDKRSIQNTAAH